jgi:hypothetical protein
VIYETDDDNCPEEPNLIYLDEYTHANEIQTEYQTENAYAHFGQPSVWQRGASPAVVAACARAAIVSIALPLDRHPG